jgi:hypothetical protein
MSHYAEPIIRMYDTVFHRAPDMAGQTFWDNALHQGFTLHDIAGQFVTAPEFAATYGQPDSTSFVQSMYQNVLGRGGEADGASFWAYNLDHGLTDRAEIVVAFSESAEHVAHLAAPAATPAPVSQNPASPDAGFVPMHPSGPAPTTGPTVAHHEGPHNDPAPTLAPTPANMDGNSWFVVGTEGPDLLVGRPGDNLILGSGGNDTIYGGSGNDGISGGRGDDVMTGRGGDDTFVFSRGDGYDTITDYHRGDHIRFNDVPAGDVHIMLSHGKPLPGQQGPGPGDWTVVYGQGTGQDHIGLPGITNADTAWVQDSFLFA